MWNVTHNVITLWKAQKLLVVQPRMQCLICGKHQSLFSVGIKRSLTVMQLTLKRYTLNVGNFFELGGAVRG